MSETPTSPEPTTGPIATEPPAESPTAPPAIPPHEHEHVHDRRRRGKLTAVAAWVGIVAGTVFVIAVIFFSGFILGAHAGGGHHHRGGHGDHRGGGQMHEGRPMGPMFRPGPGFVFPGGPGGFPGFGPGQPGGTGPGGPGAPGQPAAPTTPGR